MICITFDMSTKGMYQVGIAGFIILMVSQILFEIINTVPIPGDLSGILFLVSMIGIPIGVVLGSFTFLGFSKDHDSKLSWVVFIISLILPWFFLSSYVFGPILGEFQEIFFVLGSVFLGIVFLLWGSTMIVVRKEFSQPEVFLIAGIFFMLTAATLFNVYPFSTYYMIPACTISVIALYSSREFK